jgi:hypothetical protein
LKKLTFSVTITVDGFFSGPNGELDWMASASPRSSDTSAITTLAPIWGYLASLCTVAEPKPPAPLTIAEALVRSISTPLRLHRSRRSHPRHIAVGPNQHGSGNSDHAKYRKLPPTHVFGVDHLDPIRPGRDVEATRVARPTEVEQHRPGSVQQGEDPQRAVVVSGGGQVEIGYAASEQWVSLASVAEVVVNVPT